MINRGLVACVHPQHQRRDPRVDIGDRLQNAFTHPLLLVSIAEFHGFVFAGGCAARNQGASERSAFQGHFALKRWVSAGIKDLTGVDGIDFKHVLCSSVRCGSEVYETAPQKCGVGAPRIVSIASSRAERMSGRDRVPHVTHHPTHRFHRRVGSAC